MSIKMVALKTFLGRGSEIAGDASGNVRRGNEFECDNETRANELERVGLARRNLTAEIAASGRNRRKANAAAGAGPLASAGGKTGGGGSSSSSLPGLQPQERAPRLRKPRRKKGAGGQG